MQLFHHLFLSIINLASTETDYLLLRFMDFITFRRSQILQLEKKTYLLARIIREGIKRISFKDKEHHNQVAGLMK